MHITIIGAGVAGLTVALELAKQGLKVEVLERSTRLGLFACSTLAGGMISRWCEMETADPAISEMGETSLDWWRENFEGLVQKGSLVVAATRDGVELTRFAARTRNYRWLHEGELNLEPDLAGRFPRGLFYADEAHLDPRAALQSLAESVKRLGGVIKFGVDGTANQYSDTGDGDWLIDCRGMAARDQLKDLRGVRGEMMLVRTRELAFSRPVRLLHPRFPLYVVPRGDGVYMIGATVLESQSKARISARSAVELLNAAYALHPAFAEAEILEMGADIRPAFPDNVPKLVQNGRTLFINGLYRHGFLAAPALALKAVALILAETGKENAHLRQRNLAGHQGEGVERGA